MSKQSKDRLEEFFIKGTQNYNFEFNENDWLKLEKKLDQIDGKPLPFWRSNGFYALVVSTILVVASLFFVPELISPNETVQQTNKIEEPAQSIGNEETKQNVDVKENNNAQNSSVLSAQSQNEGIADEFESKSPSETVVSNDVDSEESALIGEDLNEDLLNPEQTTDEIGDSRSTALVENYTENNHGEFIGSGQSLYDAQHIIPIGLRQNNFGFEYAQINQVERSGEHDLIHVEEDDRNTYQPSFSVSFTVSPDFSSVGIGNYSKPGTRFGAFLTGSLSNKFSIRAGAIMTENIYSARGEDYNPSLGGYSTFVRPESAEGQCKIVDIPLSLRYNILQKSRNKWYVVGGLTSYIMLDEEYQFSFDGNPPPNSMDSWESEKTSSHILGLINFSTGYEHYLAPRWSVQVEPFINIPITGIGWGNVDLYSFGSYFTIKHHLYRKRNR